MYLIPILFLIGIAVTITGIVIMSVFKSLKIELTKKEIELILKWYGIGHTDKQIDEPLYNKLKGYLDK